MFVFSRVGACKEFILSLGAQMQKTNNDATESLVGLEQQSVLENIFKFPDAKISLIANTGASAGWGGLSVSLIGLFRPLTHSIYKWLLDNINRFMALISSLIALMN